MKRTVTSWIVLLGVVVAASSCGPNRRILESANGESSNGEPGAAAANAAPAQSGFEQDLNAMRTADFKFIIVFRRKDGKALEQGDKELIGNAASQANRRRLSDEGKAVIIGSNFPFAAGAFAGLTERFSMENYSKPDSGPMYTNSNSNQ
ncbi:MAG TPA: hypothetical protein VMZ26_12745 [Pyrinomonadaceae bacterium]|nr:hypothetical protein [Pyrinomonadaceae bacterium]